MSLTARHLEANGLPTVVIGSARDIVEQAGVARFLFSDFPLGNPCGIPYDVEMQTAIVSLVRLEQRCSRRRSSPQAHRALADLRRQLGLDEE